MTTTKKKLSNITGREWFTEHFRGKGGFKYAHNNIIMHLNWGWDNVKAVHKTIQMVGSEKFLRTHKKKAAKKGYKINKILTQENIEAFIKSGKDEPSGLVDAIAKAFGVDFEERMAGLQEPKTAPPYRGYSSSNRGAGA